MKAYPLGSLLVEAPPTTMNMQASKASFLDLLDCVKGPDNGNAQTLEALWDATESSIEAAAKEQLDAELAVLRSKEAAVKRKFEAVQADLR